MKLTILFIFLFAATIVNAQDVNNQIKQDVESELIETHIRFLASDELLGREAGTPGIDIAAAYMASFLQSTGAETVPGMDSYFQEMTIYNRSAAEEGSISIGSHSFDVKKSLASDYSDAAEVNAPAIFINFGTEKDLKKKNLEGKVVLMIPGGSSGDYREALSTTNMGSTIKKLQMEGASAVIFLWKFDELPWSRLHSWVQRGSVSTKKPSPDAIPHFYVDASSAQVMESLKNADGENVTINYGGREVMEQKTKNVLAYIEGTESPDEILLLSAHYDHIGGKFTDDGTDMIYNGARDNAVGTAAIMMAADYFADHKPKRSVIIAGWTAEEKGLLGSSYFVSNSPVELDNIIYNLNIDGAGYNDTTIVTVVGLDRTMAEEAIKGAATNFGLTAVTDPAPEQNLFDRSDNVNFARVGIPAPTFSLGFTAFDAEIMKYYHKASDEAETLNFNYVTKYTWAYIAAAERIANKKTETFWVSGDKYEEAGKELYDK